MKTIESMRVLGLSKKEEKVFVGLRGGADTPLTLSGKTKISRPAIYAILKKLKERGLITSRITNHRKHWILSNARVIETALYDTKRFLLQIPEGREEIHGRVDSAVVVHRGVRAIKALFWELFERHLSERFYGIQGHVSSIGWNHIFSISETNKINRAIKKNHIISEGILPKGWFEEQTKLFGVEWAKDFEGRTTRINVIDPHYFNHGAQIWVFKDSLYLMAFGEELVIEVRNSEIQKIILALFEFIQDNSRTIDPNALLRELMMKYFKKNKVKPLRQSL